MSDLSFDAPGKLNLFLHINGQRSDGYHELQTLFQLIDWCDRLDYSLLQQPEIVLSSDHPSLSCVDNLVCKAAYALQQYTGCQLGARIFLQKQLPIGGGLGGGSSNAATTLIALNQLWKLGLSTSQLMEIGVGLGADVPVFVQGKTALAQGIGEQLLTINRPEEWYLIIAPDCVVSTAFVFQHPELTRNTPRVALQQLSDASRSPVAWHNDFQSLVCAHYPMIDQLFRELLEYGTPRLTGSGGCVFLHFEKEATARRVHEQLSARWRTHVTRGIHCSPILNTIRACN